MKDYNEKAAILAIHYALNVKPGDLVMIQGSEVANDLMKAVYIEALKAGGHPQIMSEVNGINVAKFKYGSDEQLVFVNPLLKFMVTKVDKIINIFADFNRQELSLVDPNKIKLTTSSPEYMEMLNDNQTVTKRCLEEQSISNLQKPVLGQKHILNSFPNMHIKKA